MPISASSAGHFTSHPRESTGIRTEDMILGNLRTLESKLQGHVRKGQERVEIKLSRKIY